MLNYRLVVTFTCRALLATQIYHHFTSFKDRLITKITYLLYVLSQVAAWASGL